ncbi:MAG: hypothetical protein ABI615_05815 [Chthoniobacterales bacterium]
MKKSKALLTGAAVAGLLTGSFAVQAHAAGQTTGAGTTLQTLADKSANSCSGKSGCKSQNGCKGHNSCKGKGGCKSSDNGCKGKNSCKGKGGCANTPAKPAN